MSTQKRVVFIAFILVAVAVFLYWIVSGTATSSRTGSARAGEVFASTVGTKSNLSSSVSCRNSYMVRKDGIFEWYIFELPPSRMNEFVNAFMSHAPDDAPQSYWRAFNVVPTRLRNPIGGVVDPSWWTPESVQDVEELKKVHYRNWDGAKGTEATAGYWVVLSRTSGVIYLFTWMI